MSSRISSNHYKSMFIISTDEYDNLKKQNSLGHSVSDGVSGGIHESQVNNIEVRNGGTILIREDEQGKIHSSNLDYCKKDEIIDESSNDSRISFNTPAHARHTSDRLRGLRGEGRLSDGSFSTSRNVRGGERRVNEHEKQMEGHKNRGMRGKRNADGSRRERAATYREKSSTLPNEDVHMEELIDKRLEQLQGGEKKDPSTKQPLSIPMEIDDFNENNDVKSKKQPKSKGAKKRNALDNEDFRPSFLKNHRYSSPSPSESDISDIDSSLAWKPIRKSASNERSDVTKSPTAQRSSTTQQAVTKSRKRSATRLPTGVIKELKQSGTKRSSDTLAYSAGKRRGNKFSKAETYTQPKPIRFIPPSVKRKNLDELTSSRKSQKQEQTRGKKRNWQSMISPTPRANTKKRIFDGGYDDYTSNAVPLGNRKRDWDSMDFASFRDDDKKRRISDEGEYPLWKPADDRLGRKRALKSDSDNSDEEPPTKKTQVDGSNHDNYDIW